MKISNVSLRNYNSVIGDITASDNGSSVSIELTSAEAAQLYSVAEDIMMARREALAASIAAMQPLHLTAQDGEFTDVD